MNKIYYINSQLAQIEGELMSMHEGIDLMQSEVNLDNLSKVLLELSKRLNKIQKEIATIADPEIIICAAVKFKGNIIMRCHRHYQPINERNREGLDTIGRIEGFMTSRNRFVDRKEAQRIQKDAGIESVAKGGYFGNELYSEDLY